MTRANLLLIRELNVNGDGDIADVMIQLECPLTPEQKRALRVELTRLKQILDDPDTDSIVELAIHNILGSAAAQSGYDLIEF